MRRSPLDLTFLLVAVLIIGLGVALARADDDDALDHELARQALLDGRIMSLVDITTKVKPDLPGEIQGVELEREDDGSFVYEFKVLTTEGRLKEVEVDATNGKILKIEDD